MQKTFKSRNNFKSELTRISSFDASKNRTEDYCDPNLFKAKPLMRSSYSPFQMSQPLDKKYFN